MLSIDPGPTQSGVAVFDGDLIWAGVERNTDVLLRLERCACTHVVIERVQSYGRAVGLSTFETIFWTGRFYEAACGRNFIVQRIYFRDVRQHLCGKHPAKERDVWAQLLERYGGKAVALGTKAQPGPLYHVRSHARSALALAVTWADRTQGLRDQQAALARDVTPY